MVRLGETPNRGRFAVKTAQKDVPTACLQVGGQQVCPSSTKSVLSPPTEYKEDVRTPVMSPSAPPAQSTVHKLPLSPPLSGRSAPNVIDSKDEPLGEVEELLHPLQQMAMASQGEGAEEPTSNESSLQQAEAATPAEAPRALEWSGEPPAAMELARGLGTVLARLAASAGPAGAQPKSRFHSVRPPGMPIADYMMRIQRFFLCSGTCHVLAMIYIDRLLRRHPEVVISPLSVHRLLLISSMVAAKFHDDVFYSNAYYSKVGGIQTQESNILEARFLDMMGWELQVQPQEYTVYEEALMRAAASAAGLTGA